MHKQDICKFPPRDKKEMRNSQDKKVLAVQDKTRSCPAKQKILFSAPLKLRTIHGSNVNVLKVP